MKLSSSLIALSACISTLTGCSAFTLQTPNRFSSSLGLERNGKPDFDIFPEKYESVIERIDGGGTIKTCKLPTWANRVQYKIESFGRPVKGTVELWLGPGRSTHTLQFDTEDGIEFPIESVLQFNNGHDGSPVMVRF
jgi:hypothetical protein